MGRRLIVDTGVLVSVERSGAGATLDRDDDVVMAAVTLGELLAGVALADDQRRGARERFVAGIREIVPVIEYDERVAEAHALLLAHARRTGAPRGAHDLIIAATAIATDRILFTTDRAARFAELPGVRVVVSVP
ncbi:MAG: VapC toxin family PIN domain ribonuclease [Microbacterium sp.]|nr:MAG: VapC toxin family PIN domain ribonuclease [Microbacterium sp.]